MVNLLELVGQVGSLIPSRTRRGAGARRQRRKTGACHRSARDLGVESLEGRVLMHAPVGPPTLPHQDNPTFQAEHLALFDLVKYDDVTHHAVQSGKWSDPGTWEAGQVPTTDANVWIPQGTTVTMDFVNYTVMRTIRVDGTFQFDATTDTGLMVDTMIVSPAGTLIMGTEEAPIPSQYEAKIIIADRGPIDSHWDPRLLSRGLISHGTVMMHGDHVTSFTTLAQEPRKGDTVLTLDETPEGWKRGDRLILTGTHSSGTQDEELEILAVNGNQVSVRPLMYDHLTPATGLKVYVANVSRNVVIESQNPYDTSRRGHVMFMHAPKVDVHNVGFYGLGRTDKRTPIEDVELDAAGQRVPGTGFNVRGRYAVHFHRTGIGQGARQAVIEGSAVVDSPGWGFVSHSANVLMKDNVAFDVVGAGFVAEAGDEIGSFVHNLAVKSRGSGDGVESRERVQDFGHEGDGFWFQGGGVSAIDNVAVSQRHAGFIFFTRGLKEAGLGTATYLAANLADPSWANGKTKVDVGSVPFSLKGNVAFANGSAFESWFHLLNSSHAGRSVIEDFTAWNNRGNALFTPYTNNLTMRNVRAIGNLTRPGGTALGRNDVTRNIRYENLDLQGYRIGVMIPVNGTNVVEGGTFNNVINLHISTSMDRRRLVEIKGDIHFGTLSAAALGTQKQYDIYLQTNFNPKEMDITRLFNPDVIKLGTVMYQGKQAYYNEQAADFVPFKSGVAAAYVPPELIDKTNQQLWDMYGLAIGGIVAPANAIVDPRINGKIGDPANYLADLHLASRKYTNQLQGYQLVYKDAAGVKTIDPTPVNLREGWNLVTRNIGGHARTFLVFGDVTAPTFTLDPKLVLKINPLDLPVGFRVTGTVTDNSTGSKHFKKDFNDLLKRPILTRADGSQFIPLEFTITDLAGNSTKVSLELTIDATYPRQREITRKNLPPRVLSQTLVSLLGFKRDRIAAANGTA